MSLGGGDLQVILRRIRHGFIVCDDSELCDKIISQDVEIEQRQKKLAKSKSIDIEKTDLLSILRTDPDFIRDELSNSPEWTATNVQVQRVRCKTLGRLDEIKTENEAKRAVQIISWQDPTKAQNDNEFVHLDDENNCSTSPLFKRRTEPIQPLTQPSSLTALIRSAINQHNPFAQYAKFDGIPNRSSNQSKKFMAHFQTQKQKFQVIVSSNATVRETIGFICYKYTIENREPTLTQKDPSNFSLNIADDDGEAEEFPPLTNDRAIGEYDFPHLILIEQVTQVKPPKPNEPSGDLSTDSDSDGSFENSSRSITPSSNEHRKSASSVEKSSTINIVEDLPVEVDPIHNLSRAYESLHQRSYFFDYYAKSGSNKHVKVRLDVSGEQIRFDQLEHTSKLAGKNMSLTTQRIVACNLISKDNFRKRDRTRVHLVLGNPQGSDSSYVYETYELESTVEIAKQFRDQILNIIQLTNPQGRDIYEQQLQQRGNTKKRRSILNLFGGGPAGSG